jgi:hypothetical protein
MPKDKRRRKLKTYVFKVFLEGIGELKAPRPIPQDKVLKMAREDLDHITDNTLTDFVMSVSPLTLVAKQKSGKRKKPKKRKRRKSSKKRGKGGLRIKRKK